ncbi:hypothetical protein C8Q74DRAFT_138435 [Fomes fomentarius]|nr:hypothetical protein C8Q74DRAFT_138435 [Fomes fomentarius]
MFRLGSGIVFLTLYCLEIRITGTRHKPRGTGDNKLYQAVTRLLWSTMSKCAQPQALAPGFSWESPSLTTPSGSDSPPYAPPCMVYKRVLIPAGPRINRLSVLTACHPIPPNLPRASACRVRHLAATWYTSTTSFLSG